MFPIPVGTVCESLNGGGGGYGDPLRRDPRRVFEEVRDGLCSSERARDVYGVVVHEDMSGWDEAATEARRG